MKKIDFFSLFLLMLCWSTGLSLTSCSNDDEDEPRPNLILDGTYSSANPERLFTLTYSGAAMPGKVAFVKTTGETSALITLQGEVLLSQEALSGGTAQKSTGHQLFAGVIPGEESTQLRVKLTPQGKGIYRFESTDTQNGRTIRCKGEIRKELLNMDLQVEMPANFLSGTTWQLAEIIPSEEWGGGNLQQPIHSVWESKVSFNLGDEEYPFELDPGALLVLGLQAMPLFANKNGNELMLSLLKDVTFHTDGNITAHYSEAADIAAPQWKQSPLNIVHYYLKEGKPYLQLNLGMLLQGQKKSFINDFLGLLPLLKGMPLSILQEEGKMTVYLETETLLSILQALMPLLQDESNLTAILEKLQSDPGFASFAPMVEKVLRQLPDVLAQTTRLELGLTFTPTQS